MHDIHAGGDGLSASAMLFGRTFAEVCFGEDHNRRGAAVPDNGQITLQTPWIKILVQGHTEPDRIDVGGHGLFPAGRTGRPTQKQALARQYGLNNAEAVRGQLDHNIIADDGIIRGGGRLMPQPPGADGRHRPSEESRKYRSFS